MFIKVTAAYRGEEQLDFENLGISVSEDDFNNCIWDFLWVEYQSIVSMFINDNGLTNIDLLNGQRWTIKESPEKVQSMVNDIRDDT